MFRTATLRPGLLVSLKTSVQGNVAYSRFDIEADHVTETGSRRAKWETERTIQDAKEHEESIKVQSKVSSLIRGVCARSAFGLLCPESRADDLAKAISEARAIADAFNSTATLTRVSVNVIAGRIAADDVEAVRAINSEVRDLIASIESGVRNMDVKTIRDSADKLKQLGSMVPDATFARVQVAIDAVRATARKIVKAGESASLEIDATTLERLAQARTAFLDLDMPDQAISAPSVAARAIDMEPENRAEEIARKMGGLRPGESIVATRGNDSRAVSVPQFEL